MVDSKRYDPTITRFQKHTKNFVTGKTRKGHLESEERDSDDVVKEMGILVKINKKKQSSNGWLVKVGNKQYWCTYGDNISFKPDCTETETYYIPKQKCEVEVSIDKKSKIYTITRIKNTPTSINISANDLTIQSGGKAKVSVKKNTTEISGNSVKVENDIKVDTSKIDDMPDEISITGLYREVQEIKNISEELKDLLK